VDDGMSLPQNLGGDSCIYMAVIQAAHRGMPWSSNGARFIYIGAVVL
jgi:hypothetical protein